QAPFETLQGLLEGRQLVVGSVVDHQQRGVVLQLDRPVGRVRYQRIVTTLQIPLNSLMPVPQRSPPRQELMPDFAEVLWSGCLHRSRSDLMTDVRSPRTGRLSLRHRHRS